MSYSIKKFRSFAKVVPFDVGYVWAPVDRVRPQLEPPLTNIMTNESKKSFDMSIQLSDEHIVYMEERLQAMRHTVDQGDLQRVEAEARWNDPSYRAKYCGLK
jgi:hypothetical protein